MGPLERFRRLGEVLSTVQADADLRPLPEAEVIPLQEVLEHLLGRFLVP